MSNLIIDLDRESPVPLYHQLQTQLEAAIRDGRLPKGGFLDNEIELAERWQISRPTVRRAIQELVADGLLTRRRGVGTQVVSDQVRRPVKLSSLYDDLVEQGRTPSTIVLALKQVKAKPDVAEALGIKVDTPVVYVERCRLSGRNRLAVLRNWLIVEAAGTVTKDELTASGLYPVLRTRGVRPKFATQRVGAAVAGRTDARILEIPVGAPLLTMRRVMEDDTGRIVELGRHVYDAAHYSVEMTVIEN